MTKLIPEIIFWPVSKIYSTHIIRRKLPGWRNLVESYNIKVDKALLESKAHSFELNITPHQNLQIQYSLQLKKQ